MFAGNQNIKTFREFRYFSHIRVLGEVVTRYVSVSNCINLEEIILPDSLEKLDYQSIFNTGLRELTIPPNVQRIVSESIMRNKKLTTIIFRPIVPPEIKDNHITIHNEKLKKVYVPDNSLQAYQHKYANLNISKLLCPISEYQP
jgi:hypothetical protein